MKIFSDLKNMKNYQQIKVLIIFSLISLSLALILISQTPKVNGYEISIYSAYPWYFWFFIIISITCGIIILVQSALIKKYSFWSLGGFFLILLTNLIVLLLPIFRGYATSRRYDVLSHIGYIKDILHSGHFGNYNLYPSSHIFGAIVNIITGIKPELIVLLIPSFFLIFYIIFVHLLSRTISANYSCAIIITAFGSLLLFKEENGMFFPTFQCFEMIPLIIYLLYKAKINTENSEAYKFLLIIFLILIPFTHPGEGSLFLLVILIFFSVIPVFLKISKFSYRINKKNQLLLNIPINIILIFLLSWIAWFSSFKILGTSIKYILNWLIYRIGEPTIYLYQSTYSDLLSKANLSIFQIIDLFIKMYGQYAVYFFISICICMLFLKKIIYTRKKIFYIEITVFFLFITVGIMTLIFLLLYQHTSLIRNLNFLIFASTILNGVGFYIIFFNQENKKKIGAFLLIVLLVFCAIISIFNTFPSPIVRDSYYHVTQMELNGNDWFLHNQDNRLQCTQISFSLIRFAQASTGITKIPENLYENNILTVKDHFGYHESKVFGESFVKDVYFVDSQISRVTSQQVFPEYKEIWKFTPEDFNWFDNSDFSVDKIYTNKEFWVYYIKSINN